VTIERANRKGLHSMLVGRLVVAVKEHSLIPSSLSSGMAAYNRQQHFLLLSLLATDRRSPWPGLATFIHYSHANFLLLPKAEGFAVAKAFCGLLTFVRSFTFPPPIP
jgi:hypothetical protein